MTIQMKMKLHRRGIAVILVIILCSMSACSADRFYYENDRDPLGTISQTFGDPLWVLNNPDGSQKLIYLLRDPMGGNYYHRYFIVKDGKVTGGGIEK